MSKERKIRIANIAKELYLAGTTEPLESGDKDVVEDGVTSQPLEENQEEEDQ
jgi:hypothetical protein